MSAVAITALHVRCHCGIYQPIAGCIFHQAGDLEQRVSTLLNDIAVVDAEDGKHLREPVKWLAFALAMGTPAGIRREGGLVFFGDVTFDFAPTREYRHDYLSREEQAALTGEALAGRWPWSAS